MLAATSIGANNSPSTDRSLATNTGLLNAGVALVSHPVAKVLTALCIAAATFTRGLGIQDSQTPSSSDPFGPQTSRVPLDSLAHPSEDFLAWEQHRLISLIQKTDEFVARDHEVYVPSNVYQLIVLSIEQCTALIAEWQHWLLDGSFSLSPRLLSPTFPARSDAIREIATMARHAERGGVPYTNTQLIEGVREVSQNAAKTVISNMRPFVEMLKTMEGDFQDYAESLIAILIYGVRKLGHYAFTLALDLPFTEGRDSKLGLVTSWLQSMRKKYYPVPFAQGSSTKSTKGQL